MKKGAWVLSVMGLVCLLCCGSAGAFPAVEKEVLGRAREAVNPLLGGVAINGVALLGNDSASPHLLRFVIEFNKPVKEAHGYWSGKAVSRSGLLSKGVSVSIMDDYGYVWIATLDLKTIGRVAGTLNDEFELIVGCNNPVSGYPNFRTIVIRPDRTVPDGQWANYFGSVPLEIILQKWSNERQVFETEHVTHSTPSR